MKKGAVILAVAVCTAGSAWAAESVADEKPLTERIRGRSFPSVFQAWNPADNRRRISSRRRRATT
jgi:hypothetical protein